MLARPYQVKAKGVRRKAGQMNGTEAAYAAHLEMLLRERAIAWYAFEGITLKLAHDTRYTPDFVVMLLDGTIECHEVKGFWRDDAMVKMKVAAATYPFVFRVVKKSRMGFEISDVAAALVTVGGGPADKPSVVGGGS